MYKMCNPGYLSMVVNDELQLIYNILEFLFLPIVVRHLTASQRLGTTKQQSLRVLFRQYCSCFVFSRSEILPPPKIYSNISKIYKDVPRFTK